MVKASWTLWINLVIFSSPTPSACIENINTLLSYFFHQMKIKIKFSSSKIFKGICTNYIPDRCAL